MAKTNKNRVGPNVERSAIAMTPMEIQDGPASIAETGVVQPPAELSDKNTLKLAPFDEEKDVYPDGTVLYRVVGPTYASLTNGKAEAYANRLRASKGLGNGVINLNYTSQIYSVDSKTLKPIGTPTETTPWCKNVYIAS